MIKRAQKVESLIAKGRILIIYGPRRVGKTTITKEYFDSLPKDEKSIYLVGDDIKLQELFNSLDRKKILDFVNFYQNIIIDEAQYIAKIGLAIKMIIDTYPDKNIVLTGSSSFNLSQQTGEPLTGRQFTTTLLPISQKEINLSKFELENNLSEYLIYGSYPEIILAKDSQGKKRILNELVNSYLLKDILILDKIKSSQTILDILKAISFQVGKEVSYSEIGKLVGRDVRTIQRYIDILEKAFVIKKVMAYSNNLRSEISRKNKFYFYDLGIRNAIVNQFSELSYRNDVGALWENFIFMELYKKSLIENKYENFYFWRTKDGKEVDILIEKDGKIKAIECKFTKSDNHNFKAFLKYYPESKTLVINKENYLDFLI